MYFKSLLLFLAVAFLSACGASASPSASSEDLLNNPPLDTVSSYYGLGHGKTIEKAKKDALGVISSNITVEVSSTFENSVTATRQGDVSMVLSDVKSDTITKSKSIQFGEAKVLASKKGSNGWDVLVEVNRFLLSETYKRKLDKADRKLKTEWSIYQTADASEKLKVSVNIEKLLQETDSLFPIIHVIDTHFDASEYTSRYAEYTQAIRESKRGLVFKIEADQNSKTLASLIRSRLSAQNATFSDSDYTMLLKITTKAKKKKYKSENAKFAALTFALRITNIKAYDRSGKMTSKVTYKTKEGSSKGFQDAILRTTKYKKKLDEVGVMAFITGN